jgi:magnesium-protoporphyrin O-methyltransferase
VAFCDRCSCSTTSALFLSQTVDDKTEVREYFNTEGFSRWNKIYSDSDEVNSVQLDIRNGHDQTIRKIIQWIESDADISGKTVKDCGCGVGSLAIPLAQMGEFRFLDFSLSLLSLLLYLNRTCKDSKERKIMYFWLSYPSMGLLWFLFIGAKVTASDISDAMSSEAARRAKALGITNANFYTSDLESVTGNYHTVSCVDVAIHYPTDQMVGMISHLCSLADDRVIISFAPKTWYYVALKKIGELFPGPSKTTRAYLHEENVVRNALKNAGFQVTREDMTATNFYFSRLFEARRI